MTPRGAVSSSSSLHPGRRPGGISHVSVMFGRGGTGHSSVCSFYIVVGRPLAGVSGPHLDSIVEDRLTGLIFVVIIVRQWFCGR